MKNKFYKNLFQAISCFIAILFFVIVLILIFVESMHYKSDFGWILLIVALFLIISFFLLGFYWIFQKVIIDEKGIKIVIIHKILKDYTWNEISIIEETNIMKNPALRIKILDGSEIHLDKRKSIIETIKKYSGKNIIK